MRGRDVVVDPPKSSHVSTTAVRRHSGLRWIPFNISTVQFSPSQIDPAAGWSDSSTSGTSHETYGRSPVARSVRNRSSSTTLRYPGPKRMWRIHFMVFT